MYICIYVCIYVCRDTKLKTVGSVSISRGRLITSNLFVIILLLTISTMFISTLRPVLQSSSSWELAKFKICSLPLHGFLINLKFIDCKF
jgi:hypothetical protein